jgi:DNA-binding CsgD family transcriptional regulator
LVLGEYGPENIYAPVHSVAALFAYYLGNPERGIQLVTRSLDLLGSDCDPADLGYANYVKAGILIGTGEYRDAIHYLDKALAFFADATDYSWEGLLCHLRGVAIFGLGQADEAVRWIEQSLQIQRRQGDQWGTALALDYFGLVSACAGKQEQAAAALRESLALWQSFGTNVKFSDWLMRVATLTASAHPPEEVARLIGAAEGIRDSLGSVWEMPERQVYERTLIDVQAKLGQQPWQRFQAGGRLLSADVAATAALGMLESILVAGNQDKSPTADLGLTAREQDVLRLIAAGKSDREIADELFISPRTAQTHVSNLLGKLGVNKRSEAAVLAIRHNL